MTCRSAGHSCTPSLKVPPLFMFWGLRIRKGIRTERVNDNGFQPLHSSVHIISYAGPYMKLSWITLGCSSSRVVQGATQVSRTIPESTGSPEDCLLTPWCWACSPISGLWHSNNHITFSFMWTKQRRRWLICCCGDGPHHQVHGNPSGWWADLLHLH